MQERFPLQQTVDPEMYHYENEEFPSLWLRTRPSKQINKQYMTPYWPAFGFSKKVLEEPKHKTQDMDPFKNHRGLLPEELKLPEHLSVKQPG